jgi:hypothetical protein
LFCDFVFLWQVLLLLFLCRRPVRRVVWRKAEYYFGDFVPARRFVRFTASAGFIFWRIWRDFVADFILLILLFFPRKKRSKSPAVRDAAQYLR